jgi:hypothetical protein
MKSGSRCTGNRYHSVLASARLIAMEDMAIRRSANQLIKSYGEKAVEKAASCVVELSQVGDDEGMMVWLQIMLAIRELQSRP